MAKTRTSWQAGVSGNPKGRPAVCFELQAVAREHGPHCVAILAQLAGIHGPGAANEAVRLGAARELLDRGFGKPTQPLAGDMSAQPLIVDFKWADATPVSTNTPPLIEAESDEAEADAGPRESWISSC